MLRCLVASCGKLYAPVLGSDQTANSSRVCLSPLNRGKLRHPPDNAGALRVRCRPTVGPDLVSVLVRSQTARRQATALHLCGVQSKPLPLTMRPAPSYRSDHFWFTDRLIRTKPKYWHKRKFLKRAGLRPIIRLGDSPSPQKKKTGVRPRAPFTMKTPATRRSSSRAGTAPITV